MAVIPQRQASLYAAHPTEQVLHTIHFVSSLHTVLPWIVQCHFTLLVASAFAWQVMLQGEVCSQHTLSGGKSFWILNILHGSGEHRGIQRVACTVLECTGGDVR